MTSEIRGGSDRSIQVSYLGVPEYAQLLVLVYQITYGCQNNRILTLGDMMQLYVNWFRKKANMYHPCHRSVQPRYNLYNVLTAALIPNIKIHRMYHINTGTSKFQSATAAHVATCRNT